MFTGLIETTGRIDRLDRSPAGARLRVATSIAAALQPGDSVAVNGVCLTAIVVTKNTFEADLAPETLRVTSLGSMTEGRLVNLERPVRADARMGGHFVLGHVDAIGTIRSLTPDGDCYRLDVDVPSAVWQYVIPKGSLAIDGISLTIASESAGQVGVQIVPFTFAHTSLGEASAGDVVNLEADVLGKYVARLLDARVAAR
ncbi:MAG: riboflavin synthase [Acidobacteriota bacterium]